MADAMSTGEDTGERNPFAPPPADAPDQPWRPRIPHGGHAPTQQQPAPGAPEDPSSGEPGGGTDGESGHRPGHRPGGGSGGGSAPGAPEGSYGQLPPPHQWNPGGYRNGWSAPQPPPQPRFDPNDPIQRRSRHALTAGMAGLICTLTGIWYLALLLGALALYWSISALRAGGSGEAASASPGWETSRTRPQTPAALGGLLTGAVAVLFTASAFAMQVYYEPYLTCMNDALTAEATSSCSNLAPAYLVQLTNPDGN